MTDYEAGNTYVVQDAKQINLEKHGAVLGLDQSISIQVLIFFAFRNKSLTSIGRRKTYHTNG